MATFTILYQIDQHDLIKDRDTVIQADTVQDAVTQLRLKIKNLHKIEAVSTYHEDQLGGYFENHYVEETA